MNKMGSAFGEVLPIFICNKPRHKPEFGHNLFYTRKGDVPC